MREGWVKSLAGAATALLLTLPALAAPVGKPVETQTIIVPSGEDDGTAVAEHAMPSIPSSPTTPFQSVLSQSRTTTL